MTDVAIAEIARRLAFALIDRARVRTDQAQQLVKSIEAELCAEWASEVDDYRKHQLHEE